MPSTPPQSGLRRELGRLETYATLIGILVGAGIFRVTSAASEATGPSVVLGYAVLAPIILAAAIPYAVFQSTSLGRESGGDYAHVRAVFGTGVPCFLIGWLKLVSYLSALAYIARAMAGYTNELLSIAGADVDLESGEQIVATGGIVFFGVIHCSGVKWFGRVQVWMCLILGLSILVFVLPGLFAIDFANYAPFFTDGAGGFLQALPPIFFAYAGFEAVAHAAGEVKESRATMPRAYAFGIGLTAIVFVSITAVSFGVIDADTLSASGAPMATAASSFLPVGAALLVATGGVMATATSVNVTMLVPARLAWTMAQDRLMPRWLGHVHASRGIPMRGMVLTILISVSLIWNPKLHAILGVAVFALMSVYLVHSIAMLAMPKRAPQLVEEIETKIPGARAAALVAAIAFGALIATMIYRDVSAIASRSLGERWAEYDFTGTELMVLWSMLGGALYALARRGSSVSS